MTLQAKELSRWTHDHVFDRGNPAAERGTRAVMVLTLVTMVVEIAAGSGFNSMALLADGWHMSSHAVAIGLSALAYAAARRYAHDRRFAFGTWKIEVLAGFTSALFLLGVAAMMVVGSVERFFTPQPIHFEEAIAVAVLGLIVNVISAFILGHADHGHGHSHNHNHGQDRHGHGHGHDLGHDHGRAHAHAGPAAAQGVDQDLNLRSAYLHVITDAATSLLAMAALIGGWQYGWVWLDPLMGIVGAVLVAIWARGLILDTGKVLLDREMDHPVVDEIREAVETGDAQLTDLHLWRVGRNAYSCALAIVSSDPALTADDVRARLAVHEEIVHSTIEMHYCPVTSA